MWECVETELLDSVRVQDIIADEWLYTLICSLDLSFQVPFEKHVQCYAQSSACSFIQSDMSISM
jgi:hypothetical protein